MPNYPREVCRFQYVPTLRRGSSQGSRISAGPGGSVPRGETAARDGAAPRDGAGARRAGARGGPGTRRTPGGPGGPAVLLDSVSPYGSRRVVVEYDGTTTSAYLHDKSGAIAATWIANHQPAPESSTSPDCARARRRRCPPGTPSTRTAGPLHRSRLAEGCLARGGRRRRHPGGRRAAGGHPRLVGPGQGHARLQPGRNRPDPVRLVARRRHGGSRAATPQSEQFWRWRASADSWALFQQACSAICSADSAPAAATGMSAAASSR